MPMNSGVLAFLFMVVCAIVFSSSAACLWYFTQEEEEVASPAGSPTPAVTTPLQALRSSGTKLEPAELDIGALTAPRAFTTQPTGLTGPANFTISMDLKIQNTPTDWVDIFQNISGADWPLDNDNKRKPMMGLGTPKQIHFSVSTKPGTPSGTDPNQWVASDQGGFVYTPGTKFNVTATHNATTSNIAIYIDGVLKHEKHIPSPMVYAATNNFTWAPVKPGGWGLTGYLKVNNAYWFNKVLTQAEITTLQGGTSTYMPQPLTMGTSAYVKETYMPY